MLAPTEESDPLPWLCPVVRPGPSPSLDESNTGPRSALRTFHQARRLATPPRSKTPGTGGASRVFVALHGTKAGLPPWTAARPTRTRGQRLERQARSLDIFMEHAFTSVRVITEQGQRACSGGALLLRIAHGRIEFSEATTELADLVDLGDTASSSRQSASMRLCRSRSDR